MTFLTDELGGTKKKNVRFSSLGPSSSRERKKKKEIEGTIPTVTWLKNGAWRGVFERTKIAVEHRDIPKPLLEYVVEAL